MAWYWGTIFTGLFFTNTGGKNGDTVFLGPVLWVLQNLFVRFECYRSYNINKVESFKINPNFSKIAIF